MDHISAMRTPGFLLLVIVLTVSAHAADPASRQSVTAAQLEQMVSAARIDDHDFARRLSGLELTERLNHDRRARLTAALPGGQSRVALTALADLSQFLDPPASEIIPRSPPDAATRVQIFNRAVAFVQNAIHNMPNFFATRDTSRFESRSSLRDTGQSILVQNSAFRFTDQTWVTVLYRDGTEVVEQRVGQMRGRGLTS